MSFKVGVTGNIGSGKSIVCKVFSVLGMPVFSADVAARDIINTDVDVREEMIRMFGDEVYNGTLLNSALVASKVFKDEQLLEQLNSLVHPKVGEAFHEWSGKQSTAYCIEEAAILYESGGYKNMDAVVFVSAPKELRIDRVMQRDGVDRDSVLNRMKNQWPEEDKLDRADFVITNDDQSMVLPQVLEVHHKIVDLCGRPS